MADKTALMGTEFIPDARFQALIDSLLQTVALGERAQPIPLSENHDDMDAVAFAFNALLGELRFASLSKRRVEDILNAIHDPVVVIEKSGVIRMANQAAQRWTTQDGASIFDAPFENLLVPGDDSEKLVSTWRDGIKGTNLRVRFRTADGTLIPFAVNAAPFGDDESSTGAIVLVARDLRDTMRLAEAAATAEVEVQRSKVLRAAKEEAERANLAKSAFLRNISHELRTPLTILLASTEVLTQPELSPELKVETMQRIRRAGNVLMGLIDNVLDISKIEAGRIEYKPVPFRLDEVMNDVITSFTSQAEAKGLGFFVDQPRETPILVADSLRIRQILFNLVGNAIKYTREGNVSIETQLQGKGASSRLFFAVSDTGPGIPAKEQAKLFQLFGRASNAAPIEGTGLGLYLSQKLAVGLGGALDLAEPENGASSRFELYVPVQLQSAAPLVGGSNANAPSRRAVQGLRVLIADDNPDIRGVFRTLLELEGAEVNEARNGTEAVQEALTSPFDVVLMDVRMPEKSGIEAVRELRAAGYQGAVVALTADAVRELQEECMQAGYDDYVSKPIDIDHLVAVVRKYAARGSN